MICWIIITCCRCHDAGPVQTSVLPPAVPPRAMPKDVSGLLLLLLFEITHGVDDNSHFLEKNVCMHVCSHIHIHLEKLFIFRHAKDCFQKMVCLYRNIKHVTQNLPFFLCRLISPSSLENLASA